MENSPTSSLIKIKENDNTYTPIFPVTTTDNVFYNYNENIDLNEYLNNIKMEIKNEICNKLYPVGSIYMSVNNVNPATLFGGTWQQLENRFLLGAGSDYSAGSTGGEATHKLTVNEMPSHHHQDMSLLGWPITTKDDGTEWSVQYVSMTSASFPYAEWQSPKSVGGNVAHNNMPPYLAVYIWKRIS